MTHPHDRALEAAARAQRLFFALLVSDLLPVFLLGVATVFVCVGIDALAAQEPRP